MTASPQLEDGYIRIANELIEAILGFGFTHREVLVLLSIIRKTYGYGKKKDDISASQLTELCKVPRQHVTTTLNLLAQRNVISKEKGKYGTVVGVQKNYKLWISASQMKTTPSPETGQGCPESGQGDAPDNAVPASPELGQGRPDSGRVPIQVKGCPDLGQFDSPEPGHTKDNLPKENTQKKATREKRTFKEWTDSCKAAGVDTIPADDPVFAYANELGIPIDFIRYAWVEFKRQFTNAEKTKKYKNWNQHFQNAVRRNWYGIWYEKNGAWLLTTSGKQIEIELARKAK